MGSTTNDRPEDAESYPSGRWLAAFWAAVSAMLLVQIVVLAIYLRHLGIVYSTFHEFGFMAVQISVYVVAALGARFAMQRFIPSWVNHRWPTRRRDLFAMALEISAILIALTLTTYAYSWPKVMIPVLNPSMWDSVLARIDIVLCFGINPNEVLLTVLEGAPSIVSSLLDRYYGLFVASQAAVSAWFVTDPRCRTRTAFTAGFIVLWIVGAWSYVAVPALGPVYIYDDYFQRVSALYPINGATQAALFANYVAVRGVMSGNDGLIMPHLGIAAMPSLHVGIHFFLYLWACFSRSRLRAVLLGMTMLTFFGSVALCWHYLIDGVAGLILAGLVFAGTVAGFRASGRHHLPSETEASEARS